MHAKSLFLLTTTLTAFILMVVSSVDARDYLVSNQQEYKKAVGKLKAGDNLILANGTWTDFEILFEAEGTEQKPITLMAEEKGKVILNGQSNLRLAGQYLVVKGLVFKDGFTPSGAVIAFRKDKNTLAYHSRVTETVIYHYSNPERFEIDYWVAMYGKHNRFDHNHLEGKKNKGVTMAVRLDAEESRENHHQIDHNYFGPRSILGSNGGETLRIGTSHYSLSNSFTRVENNYFDRCNGELEIISNKSAGNVFKGNVFFESRGTLTMRHGNDNFVENNIFFGNNKDHIGGIRVINKNQTIRNNYLQGLTGYRLGGGFVIMNGVPNSPINRYHQVDGAVVENNTLIDVKNIEFGSGSDAERSAVPINSTFSKNLIYNTDGKNNFAVFDDMSGITFNANKINTNAELPIKKGIDSAKFILKKAANNLQYPKGKALKDVGVSRKLTVLDKQQTGVNWFSKPDSLNKLSTGKDINVNPGLDTLAVAVMNAEQGDILHLAKGEYTLSRILTIDKALTIVAAAIDEKPTVEINFERSTLFEIIDGGSLSLKGLLISGKYAPDNAGNSVVRTQRSSMLNNYELIIEQCRIEDLDINHSFNAINVSKGSFADNIEITNSHFNNVTGAILKLDKESDDYGIYNAEYVTIDNSTFTQVQGSLVDYYRGGTDESTFGPHFTLTNSILDNVGNGKRNKSSSLMFLHGVQVTNVKDNKISNSPKIKINHTVGQPRTNISDNSFIATALPTVKELNSHLKDTAIISNNTFQQ